MADDIELCPLNTLTVVATLKTPDEKGHMLPFTDEDGNTCTAFIAGLTADETEPSDSTVALDGSLSVNGVYVGNGDWKLEFAKPSLTFALLDAAFGPDADPLLTPVLIVEWTDGRVWVPLTYVRTRQAAVVS